MAEVVRLNADRRVLYAAAAGSVVRMSHTPALGGKKADAVVSGAASLGKEQGWGKEMGKSTVQPETQVSLGRVQHYICAHKRDHHSADERTQPQPTLQADLIRLEISFGAGARNTTPPSY